MEAEAQRQLEEAEQEDVEEEGAGLPVAPKFINPASPASQTISIPGSTGRASAGSDARPSTSAAGRGLGPSAAAYGSFGGASVGSTGSGGGAAGGSLKATAHEFVPRSRLARTDAAAETAVGSAAARTTSGFSLASSAAGVAASAGRASPEEDAAADPLLTQFLSGQLIPTNRTVRAAGCWAAGQQRRLRRRGGDGLADRYPMPCCSSHVLLLWQPRRLPNLAVSTHSCRHRTTKCTGRRASSRLASKMPTWSAWGSSQRVRRRRRRRRMLQPGSGCQAKGAVQPGLSAGRGRCPQLPRRRRPGAPSGAGQVALLMLDCERGLIYGVWSAQYKVRRGTCG